MSIVRVQSFHLFRELFHFQSIPLSFVWAGFDQRLIVLQRRPFFQQIFRDGSHGADVSLNEYGELMLTPVSEGYAGVYADAAFIRASESIAFEPQPVGE